MAVKYIKYASLAVCKNGEVHRLSTDVICLGADDGIFVSKLFTAKTGKNGTRYVQVFLGEISKEEHDRILCPARRVSLRPAMRKGPDGEFIPNRHQRKHECYSVPAEKRVWFGGGVWH